MQPQPNLIFVRFMGSPTWVDAYGYTQIFDNCCHQGDVQALIELFPPGTVSTNVVNQQPFAVMFTDPTVGWFQLSGTLSDGVAFVEDAGNLLDRKINPNSFMGDQKGGTKIAFREFAAEGYASAYWSAS